MVEYCYTYYFHKLELDRARVIDREVLDLYWDYRQAQWNHDLVFQAKGYSVNVEVGATLLTINGDNGILHLRKLLDERYSNPGRPSELKRFLDESLIGIGICQVDLLFVFLPYTGPIVRLYANRFRPEMEVNLRKFLWAKTKCPEL